VGCIPSAAAQSISEPKLPKRTEHPLKPGTSRTKTDRKRRPSM